jgi:DNA gyrase inhibitor GyrI
VLGDTRGRTAALPRRIPTAFVSSPGLPHNGRGTSTQRRSSMPAPQKAMNLTQEPTIVNWPQTHYVFIEKIGPFQNTAPQAWQQLNQFVPAVLQHNEITGFMSLYKVGPKIYRAGVSVAAEPKELPTNLKYEKFNGGRYSRFVLTGSYSNLPKASGRVFEIVSEKKLQVRNDYCIEHYLNNPKTTPEDQLITEILIPTL